MAFDRRVGTALFRVHVEEARAAVSIEIYLDDRVGQEHLRPGRTAAQLDLANGALRVRGSIALRFAGPGRTSRLIADLAVFGPAGQYPFRGDVATWSWPDGVAWEERTTWITPELSATALVHCDRNQSVVVRFAGAGQPLTSVTLQIGAQDVLILESFRVGSVEIRPGARLHLQPATPSQDGLVTLRGEFTSSNFPQVRFAGAILRWSSPPSDALSTSTP